MSATVTEASPRPPSRTAVAANLLGAQAATAVTALVLNVLAARTMGPAGRGEIAQVLQICYVVVAVAIAGADRAYPVLAADPPLAVAVRQTARLVRPGVVAVGGVCLLVWPVLAVGGVRFGGSVAVLAVLVAGSAGMAALRAAAVAAGSGSVVRDATLVGQLGLLATGCVLAGMRVDGPVWWLAAYGVWLLLPVWLWRLRNRGCDRRADRLAVDPIRRLGFRLLPPALATMVMLRSDRLLLPVLGTVEQLGVYMVVATVTEVAVWPVQAWLDAKAPVWARCRPSRRGRAVTLAVVVGYLFAAGVVLVVACRLLVVPVFGAAFTEAAGLAVPLAVGVVLFGAGRVGSALLVAAQAPNRVLVAEVAAAAAAVGAYLWLIPAQGAWGAAVGSAVGYGAYALLACGLAVSCRPPVRRES